VSGSDSSPTIATDARWFSGSPQEVTVVASMFAASPSIDEFVDIDIQWTNPRAVGLIASLNLGLPAGVRVQAFGRRSGDPGFAYALGGNSTAQRTLALPGGRVQHLVLPDADIAPLIGYRLRVFCDRNGATWGDDETDVGVGELGGWSVVDVPRFQEGWRRDRGSNRLRERGQDGASAFYGGDKAWRSYPCTITASIAEVYRGGLAGGTDWETIEDLLGRAAARCICIPRMRDADGALDLELAHRTAIFGTAEIQRLTSARAQRMQFGMEVSEEL
jgi:hypothetical protein